MACQRKSKIIQIYFLGYQWQGYDIWWRMKLGEKIRRLRAGRSYAEIARAGECSPPTVRDIEAGRTETPNLFLIARLSSYFDVPLDWLADETADFPPPSSPEKSAEAVVREALAGAGLIGELSSDERELIASFRNLPERNRYKLLGLAAGLGQSGSPDDCPISPSEAAEQVRKIARREVEHRQSKKDAG